MSVRASVCLSVIKTPKQLEINHSTLPTTTSQHHNTIRHYITHNITHTIKHTITHTHTNQHPHNHASGATFKPSHTTSYIPSYQLTDWLMTSLPSSLQPKLASLTFATFKTFRLVYPKISNVLLNKTFRTSTDIHENSQILFLFGTLLMEFSINKKFLNKMILSILLALTFIQKLDPLFIFYCRK